VNVVVTPQNLLRQHKDAFDLGHLD
jgi:hypothetical protein